MEIFIVYDKNDEAHLNDLKRHLKPLERSKAANIYVDGQADAGVDWEAEAKEKFEKAQLVILLLSSDFVSNDRCFGFGEQAIAKHTEGKTKVLPVLARACFLEGTALANVPSTPSEKPISEHEEADSVYEDLVREIAAIINPPAAPKKREPDENGSYELLYSDLIGIWVESAQTVEEFDSDKEAELSGAEYHFEKNGKLIYKNGTNIIIYNRTEIMGKFLSFVISEDETEAYEILFFDGERSLVFTGSDMVYILYKPTPEELAEAELT